MLHGNQEESRQEKETLADDARPMKSPKPLAGSTSREAFPLSANIRLFSKSPEDCRVTTGQLSLLSGT